MALAEVRQLSVTNIHGSPVAIPGFSVIEPGQTCLRLLTTFEIELLIPGLDALVDDLKVTYVTDINNGGGSPGTIQIKDEGVLIGEIDCLNFVGTEVIATMTGPSEATVSISTVENASHWNTVDGVGDRSVVETTNRTSAFITAPTGGEGSPFATAGWAGSTQDATTDNALVLSTSGPVRGFSPPNPAPGDSMFTVTMYDADGSSVLETYTTPVLNATATHTSPSGRIVVDVANYTLNGLRYEAEITVAVDTEAVLVAAGRVGGRYSVEANHTVDTLLDDLGGTFTYLQPSVFLDDNPTTPSVSTITLTETVGSAVTKHLSGIEYYTLGSAFTVSVTGIDQHNRNTARTSGSLLLRGPEYGLGGIDASPLPGGNLEAEFTGWTPANDVDNIQFDYANWQITDNNFRYYGPTANVTAQARDTWASGAQLLSVGASVLVDTYSQTSTDTFEDFDDEAYREGATFAGVGTWVSTDTLLVGEALIQNSQLMVPSEATLVRNDGANSGNADWSGYNPTTGGANPDYTALVAPVEYYRRWITAPGLIPSFQLSFTGTFAAGTALADMVAGNLEIEVYRIGGLGNTGAPPGNTTPLRVHLPFNFATYDDGATLGGSGIREGSSTGNTINCTFGTGTPADGGMYTVVRINNTNIKIESIGVTFF